jgi:hypothetical protein
MQEARGPLPCLSTGRARSKYVRLKNTRSIDFCAATYAAVLRMSCASGACFDSRSFVNAKAQRGQYKRTTSDAGKVHG